MRVIRRILCPVDFSDASQHAVAHAVMCARWYQASITGVFVYSPAFMPVPGPAPYAYAVAPTIAQIDKADFERDVLAFVQRANVSGVEVSAHVEIGRPAQQIVRVATELPADLVVIGTHGASGFEHLLLGSIAEKVLRTCPIPVLTVPPLARASSSLPFKRVLCPVDFSETSTAALRFALSLAEESDAEITILHVLDFPADDPMTSKHHMPKFMRDYERWAAEELKTLVPNAVRDWCRPTTRISHGKAYREILGIAAEKGADLIVMGVQGRSALDLMVFGSTTNQVVRRSTCPVLTVRNRPMPAADRK